MDSVEKICNRIQIIQTILGLNQDDFAKKLNVSQQAISRYLKDRIPKLEILSKIIDLAREAGENEITIDWVLNGGEVKASDEPQGLYTNDNIGKYKTLDKEAAEKIQDIQKIIYSSPFHRDLFYTYIHKGKQRTLFDNLNDLSDEQIELILKVIGQFKR